MDSFTDSITWSAPSNIALVKYWGKHGDQLPMNPSVSITLESSRTHTTMSWQKGGGLDFTFHQKPKPAFGEKIAKFLKGIEGERPYLKDMKLVVDSRNTFPHSAGIASSASSMAALALGLTSLHWAQDGKAPHGKAEFERFFREASELSRRASGSACRSLFARAASWGLESDLWGSPVELHAEMQGLRDAILIVDAGEKSVSSRAGHGLMHGHPYAQARFERARRHAQDMLAALKSGDWERMAAITEAEALDLHAMMLTSTPWYALLRPNTLAAIKRLRAWRESTGVAVCFTLDAGPNLHLIHPPASKDKLAAFIQEELAPLLDQGRWIDDEMGEGPLSWDSHSSPAHHS